MMKNSLIKRSITKVIRKNMGISMLLFFAIFGVVVASLIPPQILKYVIDNNLVAKNSDNLFILAVAYMGVLLFIGIFEFIKEAVLTVLGQKITKEIRIGMMEKLEKINAMFFSSNGAGTIVS
ncbi:MAG: ABC transporter transmembrane domain-containing protein, partial [Lutispora sp.]|nr:ABC transporter transmembrane domain-containing protein [Lutispora sp.]